MIRLDAVSKRYANGTLAVHELTLEVPAGEIAVLVGPSGCGKTTILRMVNRLIEPTSGRIFLEGDDVTHGDPVALRRRIGYVIQQVGLFPHQTIGSNVATVPRLLGWDRKRIAARVDELLALVGLDPAEYRERYPHQLSGGQRQRAGVARALAADPPVLLMDEPFGAIDPVTRTRLQEEFLRLQGALRKTVVFVTHDVEEAIKLGDRIAILNVGGVLEQYDTPSRILSSPASAFVASFVGRDRAIKQLKVTRVDAAMLDEPPTVAPATPIATARELLAANAMLSLPVVDEDGVLRGRVRAVDLDGRADADTCGSAAIRVDAWTDVASSLDDALANTLLSDNGWIAVLDGDRYLGVLTPDGVYRSLRVAIDREQQEGR